MNQSSGVRHLDIEGTWNLRDLGGYSTIDGHMTRWQTLYRGDAISGLPCESLRILDDLEIKTVIDLRRTEELEFAPSDFKSSQKIMYMPIDLVENAAIAGRGNIWNKTDVDRQSYKDIIDMRRQTVTKTIGALASPGTLPAIFHCGVGKDRAGLIAALILALVGVPRRVICEDYALSARYLVGLYIERQALSAKVPIGYSWQDFQREYCPQDAMLETFAHIDGTYGGVESYLLGAGLAPAQLETFRNTIVE